MEKDLSKEIERAATGVHGLDELLKGGFPAQRLYLVECNPGSGKTTLALQFLLEGVRRGQKCMYVTLSETKEELVAVAESHGFSLNAIEVYELPSLDIRTPEMAEDYSFFHPAEVELNETTRLVIDEIKKINPQRIVFDSLSELRLLAKEPLRYRRQILGIKQFFSGRNCTVLLLDDKTAGEQDLQLQSIAHGVLSLEQMTPEYGAERRRLRILKIRGSNYRGGFHDFSIVQGGLRVFPRLAPVKSLVESWQHNTLSGVKQLDELLKGGIPRGSSTLVIGPAGSGKSSITMQYILAALERGENAALFLFEEGLNTLLYRTAGLGKDLAPFLKSGQLTVRRLDPGSISPGELMCLIRSEVEERDTKVVVVDSLNGYLASMPEEKFLIMQMHELLAFLSQKGVVSFLVMAQHGLLGNIMGADVDVSYLADTVILLRYFESGGEVRRALSIVKKRSGPHENTIRELIIGSQGIDVGPPLKNFSGVLTGVPKPIP